jgi:Cu2+-exporting ATPase
VHLADPDRVVATLQLRDKMRAAAPAVVNALRAHGIAVHLMSGDGAAPVGVLARSLGIVAGRADLDPAGKLEAVRALQQAGRRVAMIGDGVNDAPVLAGADVAVAIGRGADIARTQADLVLLRDDVGVLPGVFALARQARRIIRQNLAWALLYNLACVPAAAFGYMPPWVAALGMALSSTLVLSNALRLAPVAVVDAGPAPVPVSDRGSAAPAVV